ncbi:hypothetical protein [Jatrophihabitans sp.]|uniref:hypothetical protein n=1 Tax=Jatrophihabitans sp. TaxID=1932789 RepID=UPI0030C676AC|nr:hypothetical protein [Jatrophihabitans sp.]
MTNTLQSTDIRQSPVVRLGRARAALVQLQGAAAALTLIVAAIHVIDQGGIPGNKAPSYVGVGYWLLELAALGAAVMLFRTGRPTSWLLGLGIGGGPLVGFILSRGPGLPEYTDDRGNWGEPLGIASIVVEGLLILASLAGLALAMRVQRSRAAR